MTLTSQIVIDSLRESNLIGLGESGDAAQGAEGLRLLSRIVLSVFGNEVGERLQDWQIPGFEGTTEFPWGNYIYPDMRLVIASGGSRTLKLNPEPMDGDRFQLVDAGSDFSANPITLERAAALFEGDAADYIANEDGFNATWIYRADLGDWKRVSPLEADEEFPFPEAHDDAFIGLLATRLNPRYQQSLSAESKASLVRSLSQLRAAYSRTRRTSTDLAVLRMSGSGYGNGGGPITTQRFLLGIDR